MALAAGFARDNVRPPSFLPTIKCSNCANEIDISKIGDHVCETFSEPITTYAPEPPISKGHASIPSNPFTLKRFNTGDSLTTTATPPLPQHDAIPERPIRRASRSALPKIYPDPANTPFLAPRPDALDVPPSPATSNRSGGGSNRSPAARSAFDFRPPSPELSTNLDCAFPPFPTAAGSGRRPSTTSNGRKTPTERAPSRGTSRLDQVQNARPDSFQKPPKSPGPQLGDSVFRKLAMLNKGPFNSRASDNRRPSEPPIDEFPYQSPKPEESQTNHSMPVLDEYPPAQLNDAQEKSLPSPPARSISEEILSPTFLGQLSMEPTSTTDPFAKHVDAASPTEESNTFPSQQESDAEDEYMPALARMRSESALQSTSRRPSIPPKSTPDQASLPTPSPRSDSLNTSRMDFRMQDAPPVPKAVQQYKQDGIHTPTDSGSSIYSMVGSTPNSTNSGASPVGSVASSVDAFAPMGYGATKYGSDEEDNKNRVADASIRHQMRPGLRAEQPIQKSPPGSFARPGLLRDADPRIEGGSATPLESPMDPALFQVQKRLGHGPELTQAIRPTPTRTQTTPGPIPRAGGPAPPALSIPTTAYSGDRSSQSAPPNGPPRLPSAGDIPQSAHPASSMRDTSLNVPLPPRSDSQGRRPMPRRVTNAKPACRGCGQMIEGKSVKAADGRLTGRWHKACFVCRSCEQPFTTADFYVFNNEPYCEHHYHEKNGSLCKGCHRGIEGQYLETSSSTRYGSADKKFHPRCFTCTTCRVVLKTDYFEITGQIFCERHALAAMRAQARPGPGLQPPDRRGLLAERRTTRLINPIMA